MHSESLLAWLGTACYTLRCILCTEDAQVKVGLVQAVRVLAVCLNVPVAMCWAAKNTRSRCPKASTCRAGYKCDTTIPSAEDSAHANVLSAKGTKMKAIKNIIINKKT